jgi:hypothetical protein
MDILEESSVKVLSYAYKDKKPTFVIGLATVALLISAVVINLLTVEQKCKERNVKKLAQRKSWWNRRKVKSIIKAHLTKEQYANESTALVNGLFDAAANSSDYDMDKLILSIKQKNHIN